MPVEVVRVERYGTKTIEQPALDALRKTHCLCRHCARLKPQQADNCLIAETMFGLCQEHGMAMGVSRCASFVQK